MAKYDAFGREIGEDTLSGLGGGSVVEPVPQPDEPRAEPTELPASEPVVSADPVQTVAAPPDPTIRQPGQMWPKRRSRPTGRMWRLAAVLVVIGFGIQLAVESGIDGVGDEDEVVTPLAPVGVDDGNKAATLLSPQRFGAAMDKLRSTDRGRLFNLRLAKDRIDAQLVTGDGRIRITQISPALELRTLATVGGGSGVPTFSLEDVHARAPQRLIRAGARRLDQPRRNVNYLVLTRFGTDLQWAVYFKNGRYAVADAQGRIKRVY